MDDPVLVRGFERLRDLSRDRQRLVERDRSLRDAIGERWSLDELEDERVPGPAKAGPYGIVGATFRWPFFESVDRGDVRMIQRREHLRFAPEAREPVGIEGEELRKDLQADVACSVPSRARYTSPMPPAPSGATIS